MKDDFEVRDAEICRLYVSGQTLQEIGTGVNLTRSRVQQILRQRGVKRSDRKTKDARDQFLGVNLSSKVKKALTREAKRRGVSMSSLSSDALQDMLKSCQEDE